MNKFNQARQKQRSDEEQAEMFAALTAIFACRTRDIATEIILQSSA